MDIAEYLAASRGRATEVAARAGLTTAFLSQIARKTRKCPAERGADLERACEHQVRRWELRPDDWHRIWPELIGADGAPPAPVVEGVTA